LLAIEVNSLGWGEDVAKASLLFEDRRH
jgi:hypothetical protein